MKEILHENTPANVPVLIQKPKSDIGLMLLEATALGMTYYDHCWELK